MILLIVRMPNQLCQNQPALRSAVELHAVRCYTKIRYRGRYFEVMRETEIAMLHDTLRIIRAGGYFKNRKAVPLKHTD